SNQALIPNANLGVAYTSPNAVGTLSFKPAAGVSGTATITVTVKDNGGTANPGDANTTTQAFLVTVTPINQAPTLRPIGTPVPVLATSGPQSVSLTGIGAGPGDTTQPPPVTAQSNNQALIPNANLAVAYNSPNATGTLTYTPATGQFGTALITVTVTDSG